MARHLLDGGPDPPRKGATRGRSRPSKALGLSATQNAEKGITTATAVGNDPEWLVSHFSLPTKNPPMPSACFHISFGNLV